MCLAGMIFLKFHQAPSPNPSLDPELLKVGSASLCSCHPNTPCFQPVCSLLSGLPHVIPCSPELPHPLRPVHVGLFSRPQAEGGSFEELSLSLAGQGLEPHGALIPLHPLCCCFTFTRVGTVGMEVSPVLWGSCFLFLN